MSSETFLGQSILENLRKLSLTSIEKAPVTQPNIYSLAQAHVTWISSYFLVMYVVGHQLLKFSQILTIAARGKNWRLSLAQTETSK